MSACTFIDFGMKNSPHVDSILWIISVVWDAILFFTRLEVISMSRECV